MTDLPSLRSVIALSAVTAMVMVSAACGSSSPEEESGSTGDPQAADGSNGGGEELEIAIAHTLYEGAPIHQGALLFEEMVEEGSDGRISVDVYPAGQLGGENDLVEGLDIGTVQVAIVGAALFSNFCPALGFFGLPYIIEGDGEEEQYESLQALAESSLVSDLVEECVAESGLRPLNTAWYYGNRHVTSNVDVDDPSDLSGLKIRTPPADLHTAPLEAFGATTVPMDFGEVYTSLQTGVIDGQENPINTIYQNALYEVQDQTTLTGHMTQNMFAVVGDEFFTSLSQDDQALVMEAINAAQERMSKEQIAANAEDLGKLEEEMTVARVDLEPFRAATESMTQEFLDNHGLDREAIRQAQQG